MLLKPVAAASIILMAASSLHAAPKQITLFNDGALAEIDATGKKGLFEVQFPGQIKDNTLRARPLDGGSILKVELLPSKIPEKIQKELDLLQEQKSRLEDRLKALETREKIFAAAAKSQSSKAPRKSKTNPDPISSVRQGTDFAIAQLESVYTARRRAESDLKKIELKKKQLMNVTNGPVARITASGASRVHAAALLTEGGWKPRYEIRIANDGQAALAMLAETTRVPDGYEAKVVASTLEMAEGQQPIPLPPGIMPKLSEWKVTLDKLSVKTAPVPLFSFNISNTTRTSLPAGDAAVYINGEYIGTASFPALKPEAVAGITNQPSK